MPRLGCLFDHGFGPQDIHGRSHDRDTTEPEEQHPLPLLCLVIVDDRARFIDRIAAIGLGAIQILGLALEKIHEAYLPAGTTT